MSKLIFVSRPTIIPKPFEVQFGLFERYLKSRGFQPQRLGANQYTTAAPLKGVIALMRRCHGAIVLGYPQYEVASTITKAAVTQEHLSMSIPTPWNQIEGTLAFKQRVPVLVVAHTGVAGGIFDLGVTGEYVHSTDLSRKNWHTEKGFKGVFEDWARKIK